MRYFTEQNLAKGAWRWAVALCAALAIGSLPVEMAGAQVRAVDPNSVIDADLNRTAVPARPVAQPAPPITDPADSAQSQTPRAETAPAVAQDETAGATAPTSVQPVPGANATYHEDDLIGAAEGVFGRGAQGLAQIIQRVLRQQGEPNGYIVGREAGGAFIFGLRYGSGTLHHKIEGEMPAYWTGPSVGFDAGANAASTFVLVYNLHDTADLYRRYPAGEGAAYFVGGFNASYLRRGDIVLIPIRLGVGARLGVNVGYMKFSEHQRWLPF